MSIDRVALSWSGGKDSVLALAALRDQGIEVAALLANVTTGVERIVMHDVRADLVHEQAASLGLAFRRMDLPEAASNEQYESATAAATQALQAEGISRIAFGDVNLADIREYREAQLTPLGMEVLFPLWHRDTTTMMDTLLTRGYRAVVVCVDTEQLDAAFCGREVDWNFLAELPADVDPAGENGEFHTFVVDGPDFTRAVPFRYGEQTIKHDRFFYQDLQPCPPPSWQRSATARRAH